MAIAAEVIRFLAIGQMLVIAGTLLRLHPRSLAARIGALFGMGMSAYLAAPFALEHAGEGALLDALRFAAYSNAFLFWLFCRSLFFERAQVGWVHYSLWAASQLVSVGVCFQFLEPLFAWGGLPELAFVRKLLPQGISLAFILAAIIATQQGARDDLVHSRVRLRRAFLGVVAFYGVLICAAEIALQGQPPSPGIEALHHLVLLALSVLFFMEIRAHPELFPSNLAAKTTPAEPSPLQKALMQAVEVERVYRQEGLTIGQLAQKLRTQEYLLRACINQELGFRNFNDFLNHYRIQEACARLRAEPNLPILNLSLELGYRSLAPFNRAFKEKVGETPTEFKRR